MEKESLYIYKLDIQGNKVKFPNSDLPAKLGEYTYSAQRMAGTPTLTANLNYPVCLDDEWTGEEFVEFRGERYYVGQVPTSSKDNKNIMYKHELQFVSERIVLENVYFMDVVTAGADTYHSNSTSVKFMGDVHEFVGRLNASMKKSGIGYSVVIDDAITSDSKLVSLDNVYLADALQSIYTIYELPYYFVGKVCHIGYTENVISTPFEYRKGLVSIKKTNANYKIVNRVTGVGSSDNIPFYYPNDDEKGAIERSQNLMPSIYRESGGAERFYNALNNKYKIPGTNNYYSFKNTYSAKKVKEIKVDFSDIKPTIEGVTNASGQLFGEIADIAFDENDSDELGTGEGNNVFNGTDEYVHSYFYIKLHIYNGDYGFNLFEQGLEGGTAVINMTTGNCAACEFEIGVTYKDGDKRAYNPVLLGPTGNLIPGDFEQKVTSNTSQYVESQQDTSKNEVWIAVKKDNTSFGVIMPNATNNYKPSIGDKFVITGIKMPKPLVLAAEKRLEEALIKYMSENNDEKFSFSLSFSRVFLANNSHLADILNENARIYIKYNNREYLMYVNSFTCKADKNCLYDISVELTDKLSANVSALRSTITEIAGSIIGDKIGSGGNVSTSDILSKVSRHFLSKRHDDRTPYKVSSDTAFEIGNFVSGASGAIIYKDKETGQTIGEIDKLYVRMKAYFESLEIVNVNSLGGKQVISPAGSVRLAMAFGAGDKYEIVTEGEDGNDVVEEVTVPQGIYRCFFLAEQDGQEVENRFKIGNQLQSKDFNIKKPGEYNQVANHYYWRLVTGISNEPVRIGELGYHYVDLSVTDCDTGSDSPAKGDVVAQLGDRNDVDYQNALVFSSVDTFSPSITLYQGINSYSLVGKDAVSYGVDKTTGKAFMNVYGEMYVGDRKGSTFIKYTQDNGVEIKGKLAVGTTIGDGKTIEQALEDATQSAIDTANENISSFTDAVTKDIEDLQNQIDGAIETWFNEPVPTLSNYPANEWTTNELKNIHLGDLYYSGAGKAYRFQMDGNNYIWKEITDSDITKALADAKKAQDTADGKRKVFVKQPTDNDEYDVGDLWVNATYGTTYSNDILRAVSSKAKGSPFSINHWTKSSKYTDDTRAEQVQQNVDKLSTNINNVSNAVNSMKDFTDTAFADGIVDRSEASAISNYIKVIETTQKDALNAYSSVYNNALLDGVAKTNLNNGYAAFNTSATELINAVNSAIADGKTTSTERANVDAKYTNFNTKYGDFVAYINVANKYIQDKINATANDALSKVVDLSYLKKALREDTSIEGGLIQSSILALGYTNEGGVYSVMSGTNGIYDDSKLGGGIASWWGGSMKDRGNYVSSNMPSDVAKALIRMDGSGYLANGGIWWGTDGYIHADPQSFIISENQLGDYLELFHIIYKGNTKDIDYIIPQYVMQKVEVATSVKIGNAYLKYDSESNSIYVEGENGDAVGFWTKGWLSAKGKNPGGSGGSDGGSSTLGELNNVGSWADEVPSSDRIMVQLAGATHWTSKNLSEIVGLDTSALADYLTKNQYAKKSDIPSLAGYATQQWVLNKGYLTSAGLSGYATESWVTTQLNGYATTSALTAVSNKLNDFLTGTDTDNVINKWKELEAFLAGFQETDTLAGALSLKADKARKIIAGTGISGGGDLTADRTLSLRTASATGLGGIKVGSRLSIDANGVLSATYTYTLPTASSTVLGGVKVGTTLAISSGTLNLKSTGTAGTYFKVTTDAYGRVTSGSNPTTLAGFGITDAFTKNEINNKLSDYVKTTDMNTQLAKKVDVSFFSRVFGLIGSDGDEISINDMDAVITSIKAKFGLWTNEWMSVKGMNPGTGGSGSGSSASALYQLNDVRPNSDGTGVFGASAGKVLTFGDDGKWYAASGLDSNAMWAELAKSDATKKIDLSHIPTSSLDGRYVTLGTVQKITGEKTYAKGIRVTGGDGGRYTILKAGGFQLLTGGGGYADGLYYSRSEDSTDAAIGAYLDSTGLIYYYFGTSVSTPVVKISPVGNITAKSYVKSGGTSSQFLKADGSVDSKQYAVATDVYTKTQSDGRFMRHERVERLDANTLLTGSPRIYELYQGTNIPLSNNSWHQIMTWGTADLAYGFQLANGYSRDGVLMFRNKVGGNWGVWHNVLHKENYQSILNNTYVKKSGDAMTGVLNTCAIKGMYISGKTSASIRFKSLNPIDGESFWSFYNMKSQSGNVVVFGGIRDDIGFYGYKSDRAENGYDWKFIFDTSSGNVDVSNGLVKSKAGFVKAGFTDTSVLLAGGGTKLLTDFAMSNAYLRLAGGTMTGALNLKPEQYNGNYALNLNNSNIVGVNNIMFADLADNPGEGLMFKRSNGNYDSIWAADGVPKFSPNCVYGSAPSYPTTYKIWHEGNDGSGSGLDADMLDGSHASAFLTLSTDQTITGKKTFTAPVLIRNNNYNKQLVLATVGADAKNKAAGIMFQTNDGNNTQDVILRHEWYDTFVPGYGLAISKWNSLEAGDSNMFFYNTGRYISKAPTGTAPYQCVSTTLNSNLNADLLDGYHETSFVRSFWTSRPGYDCNTFNSRSIISFTYSNNAPFTGGFIDVNTNGYGFYLGCGYGEGNPLYYKTHGTSTDLGMGTWRQLARVTDNVASATKLQNSRTLWGRPFDGTANVDGAIKGVTEINSLSKSSYGNFGIFCGLVTGESFRLDSYNASGTWIANSISVGTNGNVIIGGVGTTSYKLDVRGTVKSSSIENAGQYYSLKNSVYSNTVENLLNSSNSVFRAQSKGVATNTCYNILGWSDTINNGIGYITRYSIASTRGTSGWGAMVFTVGNNDSGTTGHTCSISGGGTMSWSGTFKSTVGIWSDGYLSAKGQNTSDLRLKKDIRDFNATSILRMLRPVSFKWNALARKNSKVFDTDETQYGLIAQEVKVVAPWAATDNMFDDGYMGVRYEKFIPILMKSQIETIDEVTILKRRITAIEKENALLREKLERLSA